MRYTQAKKLADRIFELLQPHTTKIDIAGSVRRRKSDCGDIEIVCWPRRIDVPVDLFGNTKNIVDPVFEKALHTFTDKIEEGSVHGRYMKIKLIGGMQLDLFIPQPHDYYRILAIRTGSSEYSHKVIAAAWTAKGWVGTPQGLRRQLDCTRTKSGGWACFVQNPELPPVWESEEEFFTWLGLPYLEPTKREWKEKKLLNAYQ